MSRLVSKILLALLMLPLAGVVYMVAFVLAVELRGNWSTGWQSIAFGVSTLVTWTFMAVYWTMLWRGPVRWSRPRVTLTLVAVPLVLIPAGVVGVLMGMVEEELGMFVGGIVAILLWLTSTIFIWRETASERTARIARRGFGTVVCPSCGYNLTGLRESACPECGAGYTLDELMAAQPEQAANELEERE